MRDLRVGFIRHFHEIDVPAEPEVTAALEHVARTLQLEGAEVRDVRLPTLGEFGAVNRVILQSEAWAIHGKWLRERPGDYGQLARLRLRYQRVGLADGRHRGQDRWFTGGHAPGGGTRLRTGTGSRRPAAPTRRPRRR